MFIGNNGWPTRFSYAPINLPVAAAVLHGSRSGLKHMEPITKPTAPANSKGCRYMGPDRANRSGHSYADYVFLSVHKIWLASYA